MKKGFVFALCILLVILPAATGLAATTYTLPEKMEKQLSIGSGLKGSFQLSAEGKDDLLLSLEPILNVPFQMRGMKSEDQWHYYVYQAGENETQKGLTECYYDGTQTFLRSDLLPGKVLSLPSSEEIVDLLTGKKGGNPPFASILLRLANLSAEDKEMKWRPFVEKMAQRIELWIAGFAVTSNVHSQGNGSMVEQNYTIPMSELKKEILRLMGEIRSDPDAAALFDLLMNKAQKKVYLNAYLDYFYLEAMNALEDDFDVTLSRTISTMGAEIHSEIELPLDTNRFGYSSLIIGNGDGKLTCQLKNDKETLILETEDDLTTENFNGITLWISRIPDAEESQGIEGLALRAQLLKTTETYTDEETRDHLKELWSLHIEKDTSHLPENEDAAAYSSFSPISGGLNLHYFSKYSQSSPTTLEITAFIETENLKLNLEGQWKTASPWIFSPFDTNGAQNIFKMNDADRILYLAEWLASAGEQLSKENREETVAATAVPAATEETENTEPESAGEETESSDIGNETADENGTAMTETGSSESEESSETASETEDTAAGEAPAEEDAKGSEESEEAAPAEDADNTQV